MNKILSKWTYIKANNRRNAEYGRGHEEQVYFESPPKQNTPNNSKR